MHGELGNKLVTNAKRIQTLPNLPPYSTELVRAITREVRDLDRDVSRILAPYSGSFTPASDPATACALLVNHLSMRRNKRCLLAYHRVRAEKLEALVWEGKDVLDPHAPGQQDTLDGGGEGASNQNSLSPEEEEYFRQYSDMLAAYKGQWTDIDLTGSLEPPKDLFIDVRVLKDAGEIQTEYGYARSPTSCSANGLGSANVISHAEQSI
jgi:GINS complex subunit 1